MAKKNAFQVLSKLKCYKSKIRAYFLIFFFSFLNFFQYKQYEWNMNHSVSFLPSFDFINSILLAPQ